MEPDVESAARSAENSTAFRALARGGFVASGVVHAVIGGMALSIALTGEGESDQTSALAAVASQPFGAVALWLLAVLLLALGLFHLISGFTRRAGADGKQWWRRLSEWGQGGMAIAIGGVAASVALGNRSDGDSSAEEASRGLLDAPGGPALLGIVGAGVAIGGIVFAVMGFARSFAKGMRIPRGGLGALVVALGVVGYVAKGASVAAIGGLIALAAVRNDPDSAGALDGAIQTLYDLPGGPVIVGAIGVGLLAYGVFNAFRARFARL